jgi:hypothetical protein
MNYEDYKKVFSLKKTKYFEFYSLKPIFKNIYFLARGTLKRSKICRGESGAPNPIWREKFVRKKRRIRSFNSYFYVRFVRQFV